MVTKLPITTIRDWELEKESMRETERLFTNSIFKRQGGREQKEVEKKPQNDNIRTPPFCPLSLQHVPF